MFLFSAIAKRELKKGTFTFGGRVPKGDTTKRRHDQKETQPKGDTTKRRHDHYRDTAARAALTAPPARKKPRAPSRGRLFPISYLHKMQPIGVFDSGYGGL